MRWILLVGFMVAVGFVACVAPTQGGASSSSSSSSGVSSSASQGTMCQGGTELATACPAENAPRTPGRAAFGLEKQRLLCERELRCSTCQGCTAVPIACVNYDNAVWGYPTEAETVHDAACAQACLDALATSTCSQGSGLPPPCVDAEFRAGPVAGPGGAALGEPCVGTTCPPGAYCERFELQAFTTVPLECPVCVPALSDGAYCLTFPEHGCQQGYCASGGPGPDCRHPRRNLGERCGSSEECYSGYCKAGTCAPAERFCRGAPSPDNTICNRSLPNCVRGSVCVRGAGDFVCTPALPAGQPCNPTEDHVACQGVCVAGASSSGGTCVTPQAAPTDGQPCGQSRFGPACAPGHLTRIDANGCTCHRQRNDGETCASDLDCRNLCIRGTCATRQLNGQPCVDGQDCVSAVCTAGVCAAACSGVGSSSSGG